MRVRSRLWIGLALALALVLALAGAGCRDRHADGGIDGRPGDATDAIDARAGDAAPDAAVDAPDPGDGPGDGTPVRLPCTSSFGSALSAQYGRLDGILVAIVPPGTAGCHSDATHVHLQVQLGGAVYDVAVNVDADVYTTARDVAVDTTPWAAGWHTALLPYDFTALGLHAGDFTGSTSPQLVSDLMAELQTVNHISIYGTGYGPDGAHLIHRNNGFDGALITRPLSNPPHVRMYRFASQAF